MLVHADENQVVIGYPAEPFTNVTGVEFSVGTLLSLTSIFSLNVVGFVKNNLALWFLAVHAQGALGSRGDLLDFLDDLGEFGRSNAVLRDDIANSLAVVILFGFAFRSEGARAGLAVKQDVAAVVACRFECRLDEVDKADVNHGQFQVECAQSVREIPDTSSCP